MPQKFSVMPSLRFACNEDITGNFFAMTPVGTDSQGYGNEQASPWERIVNAMETHSPCHGSAIIENE